MEQGIYILPHKGGLILLQTGQLRKPEQSFYPHLEEDGGMRPNLVQGQQILMQESQAAFDRRTDALLAASARQQQSIDGYQATTQQLIALATMMMNQKAS